MPRCEHARTDPLWTLPARAVPIGTPAPGAAAAAAQPAGRGRAGRGRHRGRRGAPGRPGRAVRLRPDRLRRAPCSRTVGEPLVRHRRARPRPALAGPLRAARLGRRRRACRWRCRWRSVCRSGWRPASTACSTRVVSRLTDTLLAFPFLVLAVGLAAILGPSLTTATVAIGIAQIPGVIRVTRGETLRLRGLDFVAAAVADGASDLVLLRRHILPNAVNAIIVQATVAAPARDHRRGGAVVPGPRHPPAGAVARRHAGQRPAVLPRRPLDGGLPRRRDRGAHARAQPARRRPAGRPRPEGDAGDDRRCACSRSDGPDGPVPHRGRPGARGRRGVLRRRRARGARPGRRVRLRQERHRDGADPAAAAATPRSSGSVELGRLAAADAAPSRSCATCADATSPTSSRSR